MQKKVCIIYTFLFSWRVFAETFSETERHSKKKKNHPILFFKKWLQKQKEYLKHLKNNKGKHPIMPIISLLIAHKVWVIKLAMCFLGGQKGRYFSFILLLNATNPRYAPVAY